MSLVVSSIGIQLQLMEELIKQELNYYSNTEFSLPNHRVLRIPRYQRNTSFSEISDWNNSHKFSASSKLPRIFSQTDRSEVRNKKQINISSGISNPCCPIKQMDINLQPLKHLEESYYCQYLKKKSKKPLKQVEFYTSYERQKRGLSLGREIMGVGKLQQIIKRQKNSRFNVNLDEYLRTTQLFQNIEANNQK